MEESLDEILGLKTTPGHIGKFVSEGNPNCTSFQVDGVVQKNDLLLVPSTGERLLVLRTMGSFIEVARGWGSSAQVIPTGTSYLVIASAF